MGIQRLKLLLTVNSSSKVLLTVYSFKMGIFDRIIGLEKIHDRLDRIEFRLAKLEELEKAEAEPLERGEEKLLTSGGAFNDRGGSLQAAKVQGMGFSAPEPVGEKRQS